MHPGHKNLSWLSGVERRQAHSLFKEELFSVAGVDIDAADAPDDQPNAQSTGIEAKIALDAFFDFDVQVLDDDDLSLRQLSTKETVEDEFRRYLQAESTNWRSNDVMEWWSNNEGNFPTVSKMAFKYLAIPASSAPSERVFSQLKLILERKRWRMDSARLERVLLLRCNKNFSV